eukprot:13782636-Ditylum_brightwellii.AAC.1
MNTLQEAPDQLPHNIPDVSEEEEDKVTLPLLSHNQTQDHRYLRVTTALSPGKLSKPIPQVFYKKLDKTAQVSTQDLEKAAEYDMTSVEG